MIVPPLPATLAPPAPFPLVISQSRETEAVAPGVRRATYRLETNEGPLVVTVVAVDMREPTLRIGAVVANDAMISRGETVSSMAHRTGAVAGVNADYFDMGETNQPLNLVVRDGLLWRTPSRRVVMDVRTDRSVHFENVSFHGSVRYGETTIPLTSVNEWPPEGGVAALTPAYGALKMYPGVSVAALEPLDALRPPARIAGDYRVVAFDDATNAPAFVTGTLLGFGPAARALGPLPNVGDTIALDAATSPPFETMTAAVGGGPLLVANGAAVEDPNAPAPDERDRHFPVSGAATLRDGTLVFVAVDGRAPVLSIGLTRPAFASLAIGLGATDAMAFDSGGSATLVARVLGENDASVQNSPSDGAERAVADGMFVYSDAPHGPAAELVVRPNAIVALPNVAVPVKIALVDAAGHPVPLSDEPASQTIVGSATSRVALVRARGLVASVPYDVVAHLAKLAIEPDDVDPDPRAIVRFTASGFDARGRTVAIGDNVRWTSDAVDFASGVLRAPDRDVRVVAFAGGTRAEWHLRVGHHRESLAFFDAAHAAAWRFSAAPPGAPGDIAIGTTRGELSLRYDFSGAERAAYADTGISLPGEPRALTIEIDGDRSGVGVRATFANGFGDRRALTLVRAVDWLGWRAVTVALPDDLNPPVELLSFYVVDSLANAPTHAVGMLAFRKPSVVVAGSP